MGEEKTNLENHELGLKVGPTHRTYHRVSNQKRLMIIHLIQNLNHTIKQAAKAVGVGYENAKAIYRVYRESGRITQLNTGRKKH